MILPIPLMAPVINFGLTETLDELLSEEVRLERDMDALVGREPREHPACGQQLPGSEQFEPQLSAEDRQALAELHKDVDGCLLSLEGWREESRLRREKLENELAAEFGFICHSENETKSGEECQHAEDLSQDLHEDADMGRYVGGAGARQHRHREPLGPATGAQAGLPAAVGAKAEARDETRRADAERIEKLRAEVEAMRQQEAAGPYGVGTPDDSDDSAMPVGIEGLSGWCEEVDAVLQDPAFTTDLGGFVRSRKNLHEMDTGLEAAQAHIDAEILEMEELLAECSAAIQARKGIS